MVKETSNSCSHNDFNHNIVNIMLTPPLNIHTSVPSKECSTGPLDARNKGACDHLDNNSRTHVCANITPVVEKGVSKVINEDNYRSNTVNYIPNTATLDSTVCGIASNIVESSHGLQNITSSNHTRLVKWISTKDSSPADRLYVEELNNGNLNVWLRELPDSDCTLLVITEKCILGTCVCQHKIGGISAQLRPCQLFVE